MRKKRNSNEYVRYRGAGLRNETQPTMVRCSPLLTLIFRKNLPGMDELYKLPNNLPIPVDDGACDHLLGLQLPSVPLRSTSERIVDLASLPGRTVVYCYLLTGTPNSNLPAGWNEIPGARGCTPQSCAFRDHYQELQALKARVFGLSTQETAYQQEVVERLHLPFELLSDAELVFTRALGLPTFDVDSMILIKRLTLIILNQQLEKVFYPGFPPNRNAQDMMEWLSHNPLKS